MSYPDPQFRNIAIVDDDAAVRAALGSLLRSYGYAASAYDSARALLDSGTLASCHCVVSDLRMPGMSGLELLEQLRRQGDMVPLILITALPEAALRQRALRGGATCFLGKPFDASDLMRCLRQARGAGRPTATDLPPGQE